jgi:hypothetical protein
MRPCDKIFHKQGQSILELAIFGSIILFLFSILIQYGVGLNLQQHLSMQAFRKALSISKSATLNSPDGMNASLTIVKDLPTTDPANPFGVGETTPYIVQGSGTLSRLLYAKYEPGVDSDLPRVTFIINGVKKTYTTAKWKRYDCRGNNVKKKVTKYFALPMSWDTPVGPLWNWEEVKDTKLESNDYADLDNDGYAEAIMGVIRSLSQVGGYDYLDFQEGEIDLSAQVEEGEHQGLQEGYTKEVATDANIAKSEDNSGINTLRHTTLKEIITRKIKTRGGEEEVTEEIEQRKGSGWHTN